MIVSIFLLYLTLHLYGGGNFRNFKAVPDQLFLISCVVLEEVAVVVAVGKLFAWAF